MPVPEAPVDAVLKAPHHLVAAAKKSMTRAKADEYGLVIPKAPRRLDIYVSKEQLDRALRIMDALVKGIQRQGWSIEFVKIEERLEIPGRPYFANEPRDLPLERWKTCVTANGERLQISLIERRKQVPHKENERARRGMSERFWISSYPKYDLVPSGRLVLRIHSVGCCGAQREWQDAKRNKLEDRVGDIIIGLDVAFRAKRAWREKRNREEAERRMREERQRDRERREEYERKLGEDIEGMAARWTKACQIGEFLMAVSEASPEEERVPELNQWLEWASGYVRRLDPLSDPYSVPKIVEPDRLPPSVSR